ncbi:MAG: CerR family C-terminal domain-containing protein [Deltaproteobacteria bacterium]|nr:CerR family C-terminal domain-containing protein [Deltaproteobacteria bacterium]
MKSQRDDTAKTRSRLLAAAGEIFAEKGFRDATIAEISLKAGTNVAAVNYHFGSKKALYSEAWRHAFAQSIQAHPPDGGVAADETPEERLRGQVTALLQRIADENNREFRFLQREFTNPTGLLKEVMREEIRPLQQRTEKLVRELLGPQVSETDVLFCEVGIISQCINPTVIRSRSKEDREIHDGQKKIDDIDAYARHVVTFSLAGIAAVRAATEARREGRKTKTSGKGKRP